MRQLTTLMLAAALLLLAVTARAQDVPKPFSAMPADADMLIRVDLNSIGQSAALGPLLNSMKQMDPTLTQLKLDNAMTTQNPPTYGEIMVAEIAGISNPEDPSAAFGASTPKHMTIYGQFDLVALQERFAQASQKQDYKGMALFYDEGAGAWVGMPNDWTLLSGRTVEDVQAAYDAGTPEGTSRWEEPGEFGVFLSAAANAPVFFGMTVDDEMRQEIRASAQEYRQQAAMMTGGSAPPSADQVVETVAETDAVVFALRDAGGVRLDLGMAFPDAETAGRFVSAANESINQTLQTMQEQNPQQAQMMAAQFGPLLQARFQAMEDRAQLSVPIPQQMLAMMQMGMAQGMGMMQGGMGGQPQPGQPQPGMQ